MLREMESSRKLLRLADRSLGGPGCLSGSLFMGPGDI